MELTTLLKEAEAASVATRIGSRDRIAAFGARAIDGVRPWLAIPALAAFAIRVIERVGVNGEATLASQVLRSSRSKVPPQAAADIDWALQQIKAQSHGSPKRSASVRVKPAIVATRPSPSASTVSRRRAR